MSVPSDDLVARLQRELEQARLSLSAIDTLDADEAAQLEQHMDRLASRLLELTTPEPFDHVMSRLGVTPASAEDFASIAGELGSPDGEG